MERESINKNPRVYDTEWEHASILEFTDCEPDTHSQADLPEIMAGTFPAKQVTFTKIHGRQRRSCDEHPSTQVPTLGHFSTFLTPPNLNGLFHT